MTLAEGLYICKLNKYPSISSLELDQERKDYASKNRDQVPCKDEPATSKKPTIDHCRNHRGGTPYKRKSGWWCSQGYYLDVQSTTPMTLEEGINLCEMNGYQLSSLELDEERKDYAAGTQDQVPCKDKPTTKKPIIDHCRNHRGGKPYKRKSGWWCSQGYHQDVKSNTPMTLKEGINLCEMNGYQLSSLELDQERKDYATEEIEENGDQVPCEDEVKTVPTTTTESPTTTSDPCEKFPGATPYRRQYGWWCSKMFYQDMQLNAPLSYERSVGLCTLNKLPYVSSLETEQEKIDYTWLDQDQVPCEDEVKTVPTTTTEGLTTSGDPCQKYSGTTAYRRQNGWFCSKLLYQDMQLPEPMSYKEAVDFCTLNELPYVSSLETEKEKLDYTWQNQDQVPCEDDVKTTTTAAPTTTKYPCPGLLGGSTPFKRKNGWWCTKRVSQDVTYDVPFRIEDGHFACETINMRMMSFEVDEEIAAYLRQGEN
ncbi:hypothetical protein CAEBREN_13071 [Caenorhabditis brenneri]|uniref:Uncharacterized protein n=1 Tax=Caenorhabditis brenneri TaxID=135651 RepID=G0PFP4_CAEBE|nr:hypothetical protein CAEBREN_13071 [Caenorhabditis brenneri]